LGITVPSTVVLVSPQTSSKYNVCVYPGTTIASTGVAGSLLIASATYTVANRATISGILPTSGPAQGGTVIAVTGNNFPFPFTAPVAGAVAAITVSLGGVAVTPVTVASATRLTIIAPPHAAGALPLTLTVTTSGGSVPFPATGTVGNVGGFTYSNGIQISPSTGVSNTLTDLDVLGVGFSALAFATVAATPDIVGAHVYLVLGTYNPVGLSAPGGNKTVGESAECTDVAVISDTELLCSLNLRKTIDGAGVVATAAVPDGAYTVTIASNGLVDVTTTGNTNEDTNYTQSVVSSASTFTVANY
jgi:hypothetical protein